MQHGGQRFTRVGQPEARNLSEDDITLAPPWVNPVDTGSVYRAWHRTRAAWLNAGVAASQAAEWAVYVKYVDEDGVLARQRIERRSDLMTDKDFGRTAATSRIWPMLAGQHENGPRPAFAQVGGRSAVRGR